MECNRWETEGLLYTSDELDEVHKKDYEYHLEQCLFCSEELKLYSYEHEHYFKSKFFEECTTPQLDEKVETACMKIPRPVLQSGTFFSFIKKGIVSVAVLLFGISAGVYIAYNLNSGSNASAVVATSQNDSLDDTLSAETPRPQGNLNLNGVIPVDVLGR